MTDAEQKEARTETLKQLRGVKGAMETALNRIDELERCLRITKSNLSGCKRYVGPHTYVYSGSDRVKVTEQIDAYIAEIEKVL